MAATAELVSMTVYDGTTDDVLRLSGASGASYRLSVQPYDRTAPAMVSVWMKADAGMIVGVIWTNDPANAMVFQGVKSAERMIDRLGGWDELCITNGRGVKVR